MQTMNRSWPLLAGLMFAACVPAQRAGTAPTDSVFAQVQQRGQVVMGVDQYASAHIFEDLPDGGRVVLEHGSATDTAAIATIRRHMREIATDFRAGNFAKPFAVHAQAVPGTDVMTARRDMIRYEVVDRPRGAEVKIIATDSLAVTAVHQFLAFQRMDHRAAGHEAHGKP